MIAFALERRGSSFRRLGSSSGRLGGSSRSRGSSSGRLGSSSRSRCSSSRRRGISSRRLGSSSRRLGSSSGRLGSSSGRLGSSSGRLCGCLGLEPGAMFKILVLDFPCGIVSHRVPGALDVLDHAQEVAAGAVVQFVLNLDPATRCECSQSLLHARSQSLLHDPAGLLGHASVCFVFFLAACWCRVPACCFARSGKQRNLKCSEAFQKKGVAVTPPSFFALGVPLPARRIPKCRHMQAEEPQVQSKTGRDRHRRAGRPTSQ